jgi:carbohydrate kinase (thermoresistant glucokinase family)
MAHEAFPGDPRVIVVMGVSGSGKSTVAALLAVRLGSIYEDGDWLHPTSNITKMHRGVPLTDKDRRPWLEAIAARIDTFRREGPRAVVACSALRRAYRDILVGERRDVRLVYLEGDEKLVARRLAEREGHFMPPELLASQFATLEEPRADERPIVVPVASPPREAVEAIIGKLRDPQVAKRDAPLHFSFRALLPGSEEPPA